MNDERSEVIEFFIMLIRKAKVDASGPEVEIDKAAGSSIYVHLPL